MKRIEQFSVGQKATLTQRITQKEIDKFVDLTGDDNPLHVSEEYAQTTSFRGIVAHGMLGASFISTMIGKHLPGEGALWVSNKLDFLLPVRLGDTLEVTAEVTAVHASQDLLTLKVQIKNQMNQVVTAGECKVKVLDGTKPVPIPMISNDRRPVVITGAASGIGAATALELARNGHPIVLNYRSNESAAHALAKKIEEFKVPCLVFKADVTNETEVNAMAAAVRGRFGQIWGLVNAAAPSIVEKKLDTLEWSDFQVQMDGQLKSTFICTKAFLGDFSKEAGGSIVNLGSIVTDQSPPPLWTAYTVAKAAVTALTRTLTEILGPRGIRINTVAPGLTQTKFTATLPEKTRLLTEMQTPLRRLAEPDDIAKVIRFLISDDSRHITGETIRVNGGRTLV
jgi:3-oxoacyl-[acyl-carrier protein] reductase